MDGKVVYQGQTKRGNEILVRYPQKADVKEMHRYINTLSKEQTFILFQGREISLKDEKKYVESFLKQIAIHKKVMLLVFHEKTLVGISDITMHVSDAEKHIGTFGITIAKEYRGEGIGSLLMQLVFDEAKKQLADLEIVRLGVFGDNPIAKRMYEKFGFAVYGNLPKGLLHKGVKVDHFFMYKVIAQ